MKLTKVKRSNGTLAKGQNAFLMWEAIVIKASLLNQFVTKVKAQKCPADCPNWNRRALNINVGLHAPQHI